MSIYETYIEGVGDNFIRKNERHLKQVYTTFYAVSRFDGIVFHQNLVHPDP